MTNKISFIADYTIIDEEGTHLPERIPLYTPALSDPNWFGDNTISINYHVEDKSAFVSLTDINDETAGVTYANDILDRGYFVTFELKIREDKPVLVFNEAKDKPKGSGLSEAEFKKQMVYFNNNLKDKIEEHFEQIIEEIAEYFEQKGNPIEEWY
ncbi:hypothetical protein [Lactobacillus amylovorus]|uniref:hypothetical protein n=1 Tax=Lactobacillus amylovorus TaxID=1604 RepID=UPI0021A76711|nr:hypothetical protein [Lactobacillus amylovorus]